MDTVTLSYRGRTFEVRAVDLGPDWTGDASTAAIAELMPDGTTAEWDTDTPISGHVLLRLDTLAKAVRDVIEQIEDDEADRARGERMDDGQVMTAYPTGTRVCRIDDEHTTGVIVAYYHDDSGLLVAVRWHVTPTRLSRQTWLRPERLRPIGA